MATMRLSILDDYQGVALDMADWSPVRNRGVEIAVERHPFADEDAAARALAQSELVAAMRERTPFPRSLVERLPKLKLLITTGMRNASFDMAALKDRGVTVTGTGGPANVPGGGGNEDTAELAWGLILGAMRRIAEDHQLMRQGGWQTRIGHRVAGKTLGLLGLGRLGSAVARVGLAFGMKAIAWSQNLTTEKAAAQGVERVEKDDLFRRSDILSVHLVLSPRSRGLVGAREVGLMKPSAVLVNTSRGPICDTDAIIAALKEGRLAYAGFDVYDKEPLPIDHPLRTAPNVILTPHIGYVTDENYHSSYPQIVENVVAFLDGNPVRVI
jgi:phosphoglycerate dehydrogenase-like enzyme